MFMSHNIVRGHICTENSKIKVTMSRICRETQEVPAGRTQYYTISHVAFRSWSYYSSFRNLRTQPTLGGSVDVNMSCYRVSSTFSSARISSISVIIGFTSTRQGLHSAEEASHWYSFFSVVKQLSLELDFPLLMSTRLQAVDGFFLRVKCFVFLSESGFLPLPKGFKNKGKLNSPNGL